INNPAWDPSGQYLAAKKHFTSKRSLGAGEMWLFHISGGAGEQMTKRPTEQKDVNDPAFSPDGRFLYYNRDATAGRFFEYNKDSSKEIYVIERLDRRTGRIDKLTGGPGGAAKPTPSPDGKLIAFVRRVDYDTTLFVRDLESGEERRILGGLERDNQEVWALHGVYPGMAWTPDSRSIVLWDDGHIKRVDVSSQSVSTIPFRVRAKKKVAQAVRQTQPVAPDEFETKMLRDVTVSPDGSRVAFVALGHIYVRTLPDGEARRLTTLTDRFEHAPAFSRDGRSIVFATWHDRQLGELRVVPSSGGTDRVVSRRPGHYQNPKFSPDGESIVFEQVPAGYLRDPRFSHETGIYRMPARGGPAERLTRDGTVPHYGADAETLFFMRASGDETSDTRTLVALDLGTRQERELYTSDAAQDYRVSPDGRWLAFQERFNVFVAPFVRTGQTVTVGEKSKGIPVARVSKEAGRYLSWGKDATSLYWTLGAELFERSLTDTFSFLAGAPEALPDAPAEGINIGFRATADRPAGVIAFTNARIITMNGDEVIENGTVLVRGNRIAAVGPDVAVPPDAFTVDAEGKTMIPGLIDAHAHGAMGTRGIIPQHHWNQFANLAFGVTTIHDPSNDTEMIFGAAELQRVGAIRAPRIFS
ncbi:MAG: amidohydrolase, partial [Myxococcota bacterium]